MNDFAQAEAKRLIDLYLDYCSMNNVITRIDWGTKQYLLDTYSPIYDTLSSDSYVELPSETVNAIFSVVSWQQLGQIFDEGRTYLYIISSLSRLGIKGFWMSSDTVLLHIEK